MTEYRSSAARALVDLHERELRAFMTTWHAAQRAGLSLPPSEDPDCASLEALLHHVVGCARGYLDWICEILALPVPAATPLPGPEDLARAPGPVIDAVLAAWRGPLRDVDGRALDRTEARSRWGVTYCVDGMLEHAVMHPLRHRFQLEELLRAE